LLLSALLVSDLVETMHETMQQAIDKTFKLVETFLAVD
jgi:hypothetical protein